MFNRCMYEIAHEACKFYAHNVTGSDYTYWWSQFVLYLGMPWDWMTPAA